MTTCAAIPVDTSTTGFAGLLALADSCVESAFLDYLKLASNPHANNITCVRLLAIVSLLHCLKSNVYIRPRLSNRGGWSPERLSKIWHWQANLSSVLCLYVDIATHQSKWRRIVIMAMFCGCPANDRFSQERQAKTIE